MNENNALQKSSIIRETEVTSCSLTNFEHDFNSFTETELKNCLTQKNCYALLRETPSKVVEPLTGEKVIFSEITTKAIIEGIEPTETIGHVKEATPFPLVEHVKKLKQRLKYSPNQSTSFFQTLNRSTRKLQRLFWSETIRINQ